MQNGQIPCRQQPPAQPPRSHPDASASVTTVLAFQVSGSWQFAPAWLFPATQKSSEADAPPPRLRFYFKDKFQCNRQTQRQTDDAGNQAGRGLVTPEHAFQQFGSGIDQRCMLDEIGGSRY